MESPGTRAWVSDARLIVKVLLKKLPGPFCALHNLLHALLEDRIPSGLADDQVGPLHHHDTDEERRVAGELHDLPLLVGLKGESRRLSPGSPPTQPVAALPVLGVGGASPPPPVNAMTYPLLSVTVFHIVDPAVIPGLSDAQQVKGEETVLGQNHKVSEEAPQGLDHTYGGKCT